MMERSVKERQRREAKRKMFTDENVLTLPLRKKQYQVWDGGSGRGSGECVRGLSILVSPAGARSYRSTYYFPNSAKPHSRHLGRVGEMSIDDARKLCRQDRKDAANGIDPKGDRSTSDAYADVVEDYVKREQIGRLRNVSHAEAKRVLLADCEDWKMRSVATIKPQEIQRLLDLVRDGDKEKGLKPRPYLAVSLYARLRAFFAWCAKPSIGMVKTSPMVGIDMPWDGAKRRQREWFIGTAADDAIKRLWQAADQLNKVEGDYLKVLLLTGKRKSAIANMQWQEIDDTWFWNAPQSDRKNKRLHPVPLPSLAQRILHPRNESGFVFPGNDNGHVYVNGCQLQSKIIRASGIKDFILHGTRHITETKMAELNILPHIRDLLLDHAPARGSGQGYDHHPYMNEMRAAVELWSEHIEQLTTAKGVRRLR
jgi:integrase